MVEQGTPRSLEDLLSTMATLTTAQHTLLSRISAHTCPVTATDLADEASLHVSSVRETLDALTALGLIARTQLPAKGRGRPSIGYSTSVPTDPSFAAQMLTQFAAAVFECLHVADVDQTEEARAIGRAWGDRALASMHVPDHSKLGSASLTEFSLANHMGKIRLLLTALGLGATPSSVSPTAFTLTACPLTEPDNPDRLALNVRRGLVDRILERTAVSLTTWEWIPDPDDPLIATIVLTESTASWKPPTTHVHFFGGASDAAGTDMLELAEDDVPDTLGRLIVDLSRSFPALAPILDVSSYLVEQRPADRTRALRPGVRIDVLPPFAGG